MEGTTATADSKEAEGTLGGEEVSGLLGGAQQKEGRKRKKTQREKERERKVKKEDVFVERFLQLIQLIKNEKSATK